jgi:cellulose synthase operon protein C
MTPGGKTDFLAFAANRRAEAGPKPESSAPSLVHQLRAIQSDEPSAPTSSAGDATPWLRAAAVLACFDPTLLRATPGGNPPPKPLQEALSAQSHAMQSPVGQRALPLPLRRRLLAALRTRAAMSKALTANTPLPALPVQRGFAALLQGPAAVDAAITSQNLPLLGGIAEALPWVEGILDELPSSADLLAVIAKVRLTRPLVDLVGTHFAGRQDVLQDMQRQVFDPAAASKVMFLYGPGGVGKSTVLAKFALDLAASGAADMILYLNFDRAALRVEQPLTVLREIVVQLAAQLRRDDLKDLAQSIDAYILRFASNRSALETASDGGGGWDSMMGTVAGAINALPDRGPILVLVDTFERAQRHGASRVREFWRG